MTPALEWRRRARRALDALRGEGFGALLRRVSEFGGRGLRRARERVRVTLLGPPRPSAEVLVLSGQRAQSYRYRAEHTAEAMRAAGIAALALDATVFEARFTPAYLAAHRAVVLHRVRATSRLLDAVREARRISGTSFIFDTDDIVFSPAHADAARFLSVLPGGDQVNHHDECGRCAETLAACDAATGSTEHLRDELARAGRRAFVVRNAASAAMVRLSQEARARALELHSRRTRVRFGYFSGTRTHDADFQVCAEALLGLLERRPETDLLVVGFLRLDPRFERLGARVAHAPFVPWTALPSLIASVDVNLAPLEMETPFNQAKSEVKYIEAALVETPTVASPTDAFRAAIRPGENGLLAATPEEWAAALESLAAAADLRARLGRAACEDALARYTTGARGADWRAVLDAVARRERIAAAPVDGAPG
jgi:glycosyltransferase involved in cell wall biosynthesis